LKTYNNLIENNFNSNQLNEDVTSNHNVAIGEIVVGPVVGPQDINSTRPVNSTNLFTKLRTNKKLLTIIGILIIFIGMSAYLISTSLIFNHSSPKSTNNPTQILNNGSGGKRTSTSSSTNGSGGKRTSTSSSTNGSGGKRTSTSSSTNTAKTNQSPNTNSPTSPPPTSTAPTSPPSPNLIFNVVNFGADPTGATDSTSAIQAAITAASTHPGSEVYFPAGTYSLDTHVSGGVDFNINTPINIEGAGESKTFIINKIGTLSGYTPGDVVFEIVTGGTISGGGSGSTIANMSINSSTYNAATPIMDFGSNTTLENLNVTAATSTGQSDGNEFGIRVIAICNYQNVSTVYRINNVINNVTVNDYGSNSGNTALDTSCQRGLNASNITTYGDGMDIYFDQNSNYSNLNLTSGQNGSTANSQFTWVITSSQNINLDNVTTNGSGGIIEDATTLYTQNVTIDHEIMTNPLDISTLNLNLKNSYNINVKNSSLFNILLDPTNILDGVTLSNTTFSSCSRGGGGTIENLVGFSCP